MNGMLMKVAIFVFLFLVGGLPAEAVRMERTGVEGAPAVVFVPGLASHGDLWRPWAEEYADTYDVFVVTAPGFAGEQPRVGGGPFLQSTVAEIAASLKRYGVSKATIVGHSIGGLMALMLANEAPDLVGNVLVVDSLPYLAAMFMPGTEPDQARAQAYFMADRMKAMPHIAFIAQQKQGLPRLSNTPAFLPVLEKWSTASDQATVAKAFAEGLGTDYRLELKNITVRITVLAAFSKAMGVPRAQIKMLYETQYAGLRHVDVHLVDDSYHFIMIDQPEQFSQHLSNVLNQGEVR